MKATQMYMMIDFVGKMTVKKSCKCGDFGSFERLLFLLLLLFSLPKFICLATVNSVKEWNILSKL